MLPCPSVAVFTQAFTFAPIFQEIRNGPCKSLGINFPYQHAGLAVNYAIRMRCHVKSHHGSRQGIRLSPQEAFGEIDANLIHEVPREEFDPEANPETGDVFETTDEQGHAAYFVVKDIRPESVVIDFNHPLAGKEVEFAITLKAVREATPDDIKGCSCSECGGSHPHEH